MFCIPLIDAQVSGPRRLTLPCANLTDWSSRLSASAEGGTKCRAKIPSVARELNLESLSVILIWKICPGILIALQAGCCRLPDRI